MSRSDEEVAENGNWRTEVLRPLPEHPLIVSENQSCIHHHHGYAQLQHDLTILHAVEAPGECFKKCIEKKNKYMATPGEYKIIFNFFSKRIETLRWQNGP